MKLRYLLPLVALPLLISCGDDDTPEGPVIDETNVNANDVTINADFGRWEMPAMTPGDIFIAHRTSDKLMNYCLSYNLESNHSRWVAYRYDKKLASKAYPSRTDAWAPEPELKFYKTHQVASHLSDGKQQYFPGYNRGHLVGSAERYYSRQANEQTFYMSNMSPMQGDFNSTYWGEVEDMVRDVLGRKVGEGDTLYIVKGGTINNVLCTIDVVNTLQQTIKMAVPKYYFMALLMRRSTGALSAIGFWMEHKNYNNKSQEFLSTLARNCSCSIDELEERTGLDFFCNLPDDIEEKVESNYVPSVWNLK